MVTECAFVKGSQINGSHCISACLPDSKQMFIVLKNVHCLMILSFGNNSVKNYLRAEEQEESLYCVSLLEQLVIIAFLFLHFTSQVTPVIFLIYIMLYLLSFV